MSSQKNRNLIKDSINANFFYLLFIFIVFLVNSFYFVYYFDLSFLKSFLFYLFNFFAILLFSFQNKMNSIMKLNLLIQLLIFFTKLGRWYGGSRYMGTFNDPNQFSYFIFITYCFLFLFNLKNKKNNIVYLIISVFLIIQSSSTGMALGMGVFIVFWIIDLIIRIPSFIRKHKNGVVLCGLIIIFSLTFIFMFSLLNDVKYSNIINKIKSFMIVERINEKYNKFDNDKANLFEERGYDRLYYYPKYILFGAGEAKTDRWSLCFHQGEIHATFPNILFNYGILALVLISIWVFKNLRHLNSTALAVYIALIVESFTLQNGRQSLFWIIFLLGGIIKELKNEKN